MTPPVPPNRRRTATPSGMRIRQRPALTAGMITFISCPIAFDPTFERVAACWRTIDLCYAPCDPNERPQFRKDGRKAALSRMQAMSDLTIDSFVDDVAKRSNIDPAAAETAVGTILSVIQQEANPSSVTQVFDHLQGAADLAQKHAVVAGSGTGMGGALSSLAGKVIGADAGVMVAAVAQIEQTGLTLEQIKNIGGGLLSYIKDVDPALAKEIGDTVPGLREHLA